MLHKGVLGDLFFFVAKNKYAFIFYIILKIKITR